MTRTPDRKTDKISRESPGAHNTLEELRRDINAGLRQIDEGKFSPFDEAAAERIKNRGRKKLAELKSHQSCGKRGFLRAHEQLCADCADRDRF